MAGYECKINQENSKFLILVLLIHTHLRDQLAIHFGVVERLSKSCWRIDQRDYARSQRDKRDNWRGCRRGTFYDHMCC